METPAIGMEVPHDSNERPPSALILVKLRSPRFSIRSWTQPHDSVQDGYSTFPILINRTE
jgi:hypothetical protein